MTIERSGIKYELTTKEIYDCFKEQIKRDLEECLFWDFPKPYYDLEKLMDRVIPNLSNCIGKTVYEYEREIGVQ